MNKVDVFLCYRRPGAQTAKLFKRYLDEQNFSGTVWYSDSEPLGNYRTDIPVLIEEAECAVIFIDPEFTKGFIESDSRRECITAIEIIEIARKKAKTPSFNLFTVFLDRTNNLTSEESAVLEALFTQANIEDPKNAVLYFAQNNAVFFLTAIDDERFLFHHIFKNLLSNDFYKVNRSRGNFFFGQIPTYVDILIWDAVNGINIDNITFSMDPKRIPLYDKIVRFRSSIEYEVQNNQMISIIGADTVLSDDNEEKIVDIRYKLVEYKLFYKTLMLWEQLQLDHAISSYDWRTDIYPIPNAMGLAFMVVTTDHKLIFSKRSSARRIRPNEYDCSIVEGLKTEGINKRKEPYSIYEEGYLHNEIERAFCEEICDDNNFQKIKVAGIVLDKEYGQWNLIGTIHSSFSSSEIHNLHAMRADTYEVNDMYFVPFTDETGTRSLPVLKKRLPQFLKGKIWGMALAAVYATLLDLGFSNRELMELSAFLS